MKRAYISLGACVLLCGITAVKSWASSEEAIQKNLQQLIASKQCPGCNLRRTDLTRMDLQEANLQGADLSEAKLSLANLSKADLKNAVLRGASLGGADLSGADLRGADLTDAQLAGAYLREAKLDKEIHKKIQDKPSTPEVQAPFEDETSETGDEKKTISVTDAPAQEIFAPAPVPEPPAVDEEMRKEQKEVSRLSNPVPDLPERFEQAVNSEGSERAESLEAAEQTESITVAVEPLPAVPQKEKKRMR
jgi:hypothetical protein